MTTADPGPVPLRLPSILQNPASKTQRQVEAYVAQQREKAAARRDADRAEAQIVGSKRGKRVTRRMNNDALLHNPHAVAFQRSDLTPPVPLHQRPLRPAFPHDAIERAAPIPPAPLDRTDPLGASSHSGAFSTSLKGTRQLLRRRGRRSEVFVPIVEKEVRAWLDGDFALGADDDLAWRVVDASQAEVSASEPSATQSGNRRLPQQHQVRATLPPLPTADGKVPAVLELSRSAAHITWALPDSFDRLVVHLVARYYELLSWSEDQTTAAGDRVRLTHLVRPTLVKPRAPTHVLFTPETSDASGMSGSDLSGTELGNSSDSDTATEGGDRSDVEGYEADTSLTSRYADLDSDEEGAAMSLSGQLRTLDLNGDDSHALHRTISHGSSAYASSEGGSEAGLSAFGAPSEHGKSPVRGMIALPPLMERNGVTPQRLPGVVGDWSDKPTFFEFVYGV